MLRNSADFAGVGKAGGSIVWTKMEGRSNSKRRISFQDDHQFTPLSIAAPVNTTSTPLPKPAPPSLRYSTSVKRSSRVMNRHTSNQVEPRHLDSLRELKEDVSDSTPTGAFKRLQGKGLIDESRLKTDESHDCNRSMRLLLDGLEQSLARKEALIRDLALAVS